METRFAHIETENKVFEGQEVDEQFLREMSIDQDRILPDARMRHWMLAQTHIMMEQGAEEELKRYSEVSDQLGEPFNLAEATDADKQTAKKAYDAITQRIEKRDLTGEGLFEDFISERAMNLDQVSSLMTE